MLTRFVRTQLVIFAIASIVAVSTMAVVYLQAPTLLGIGRMTVTLELERTGGLYRFANVTYRGVEIGKVTEVHPTRTGATATLSLKTSPRIPVDLQADVLSLSAVGEQYVDLQPVTVSGPYLEDGAVIPKDRTSTPQAVGPMMDQMSVLLGSIPTGKVGALLDESYRALDGSGHELGSLFDSSSTLITDLNGVAGRTRSLIDDSKPLLDGQAAAAQTIRTWARSVAGITGQVVTNDAQLRNLLETAPGAADETTRLFDQLKPTLPVLLANLTTVGQIGLKYHASLEQLLVLLPPNVASLQTYGVPKNNPIGASLGDFTLTLNDPPACTVGFLPPSSWRSPADTSEIDTPDGMYCKLPQDSPIAVRGARNYPCMGNPGKRAPTVEICESADPFMPAAIRQHALGPYPFDPSLVAQGIPVDDRVDFSDQIYGPLEGTPLPPAGPAPAQPSAAPSAFSPDESSGPAVQFTNYNPRTGQYATSDGQVFRQLDLVTPAGSQSWQDLLMP